MSSFDQIWVAAPIEKIKLLKYVSEKLKNETVDIRFIPSLSGFNLINHSFTEIAGLTFFNVTISPMQEGVNRLLKRTEDVILSLIFLFISIPLLILVALLIKITSSGPIFYRQDRVGLNNKTFQILKFRSDAG